ncbi:cytochrome c oxidase assembly protein [Oceanobacillus halotolerans]|uniref:cytochrome c oxidase assembly protein n=1 Tax=Oceanobacillus halotolerans TaxID=2663380 RepID=UPI0013DA213B|nr:cytochrome c oxidase assembly protein [Oceanobacillus halotolerans]
MIDVILDEFHFSSLWNGGIFLFLSFSAIIYVLLLPASKNHSWKRIILFISGLIILFAAVGSPLNIYGRLLFSYHIGQVILLLLVAPPLILLGLKTKIPASFLKNPVVEKIKRIITSPVFTLILFNVLFYGYHIPFVFDNARVDLFLNYFYLLALFIGALLLWYPLISQTRLTRKQKGIYGITTSILLIPFSVWLLMMNTSLYNVYTDFSEFVASLEYCLPPGETLPVEYVEALLPIAPVYEQRLGGGIFLIIQILLFNGLLFFINKFNKEEM